MLDVFVDWAERMVQHCAEDDIDFQITVGEVTDNQSARLDVETSKAVARITCWASGDYNAEILDVESGETVYESHGQLDLGGSPNSHFKSFFDLLGVKAD